LRKRTRALTTCDARRFRIGRDTFTERRLARTVMVRTCRPLIEKAMSRICRPVTVTRTTRARQADCAASRALLAGADTCSPATALAGFGAGVTALAGCDAACGAGGDAAGCAGGGAGGGGGGGGGGVVHVIDSVTVPVSPVENLALTETVNGPVGAEYGTVSVPLMGLDGTTKLSFRVDTPLTTTS